MSEVRNPNCVCLYCGKAIYRRPSQLSSNRVFCSQVCHTKHRGAIEQINCLQCGNNFKPEKRTAKYCSRGCSNKGRQGISYTKQAQGNASQRRLGLLKQTFSFKTCMVEGCEYCLTFDIHRFVEGKQGGEYIIGNMFAICPNHHAEVHRGIVRFEKISDQLLKAIYI